ncbi:MAG: class I SAM-dependent RNA methyltransferase [Candidatus Promineifilaceae bacterium]
MVLKIELDKLVHGAKAIGRWKNKTVFVAGGLPNEEVRVEVIREKSRTMEARLVEIVRPSVDRVPPRFKPADIPVANFQHITYPVQLLHKEDIVRDQMTRIGKLDRVPIRPIRGNPNPWAYRIETTLSPVKDGGLGYWSPSQRAVVPVKKCDVLHPRIQQIMKGIDFDFPDLRKLTLRVGSDGEVLLVFATNDAEPPDIEIDFPVSVAIVMPDGVSATLIGEPFLVQTVREQDFRVSAGSFFQPSIEGAGLLVDTILSLADLEGDETVLELFSGVGMLTAFLAMRAKEVIGIEKNPDSIEDAAVNLDKTENVALYNDWVEDALPNIEVSPDLAVIDCGDAGISAEALHYLLEKAPPRILVSTPNIALAAQLAQPLEEAGYQLQTIQPIDLLPQTYHVHTVSLWAKKARRRHR